MECLACNRCAVRTSPFHGAVWNERPIAGIRKPRRKDLSSRVTRGAASHPGKLPRTLRHREGSLSRRLLPCPDLPRLVVADPPQPALSLYHLPVTPSRIGRGRLVRSQKHHVVASCAKRSPAAFWEIGGGVTVIS